MLYTSEEMDEKGRATVHVEVLAHVTQPEERSAQLSNRFNFTFGLAAEVGVDSGRGNAVHGRDIELRRVLPSTHEEAYRMMTR